MDGRWAGCGRAGAAEIAWKGAGGARANVRIRWTSTARMSGSGGRAVDGLRAGAAEIAWEEARDGGARANVRIWWTGGGRAVDGRELQK